MATAKGNAEVKLALVHLGLIVVVSSTVLFANLGAARLWDRDEPRNAGCAREMLERGDWVVPVFNGELRHQKPVLLYWLIMSAYSLFGVNEFSARFWSAALGVGTVVATYFIGRRLLTPRVGLLAAVVLATSMMFVVAARAATPDSALLFCGTIAILIYVLATFAPKEQLSDPPRLRFDGRYFPVKRMPVVAMYSVLGVGVLAKGPVAAILPVSIIGMFLLIQRLPPLAEAVWQDRGWLARSICWAMRPFHPVHFLRTCWSMRPITAVVTVFAVAAPWYLWVGLRTDGQWLSQFFLEEHFGRATAAFEGHSGGFWYYPLAILLGFFPWSVFAAPTLIGVDRHLSRKGNDSVAFTFLLCWVFVQVALFSLAKTKLPSYVTPCFPALALLTAATLDRWSRNKNWAPTVWYRWSLATLVISGVLLAGGLAIAGVVALEGDTTLALVGTIPLVTGLVGFWFYYRRRANHAVFACLSGATALTIAIFGFGTAAVDSHQQSHVVLNRIRQASPSVEVAAYGCLESSWVFYGEKPIRELSQVSVGLPGENDRAATRTSKEMLSPIQFVAEHPDGLILTTESARDSLLAKLPDDFQTIAESSYFLRSQRILLIGRPQRAAIAHDPPDATRR